MSEDETAGRRVGVRDVARLAGVSSQTVSRVINEHPNIRPETRSKVLDAMAALDYRVNNAARALGTRTTRTLGVVASDATLYGPSAGIGALEAAAREVGRWVATAYADAADEASVEGPRVICSARGSTGSSWWRRMPGRSSRSRGSRPACRSRRSTAGRAPIARRMPQRSPPSTSPHSGTGGSPASPGPRTGSRRWPATRASVASWPIGDSSRVRAGSATGARGAGAAIAPIVAAGGRAPGGPTAVAVANDQMALGLIAGLRAAGRATFPAR